MQSKAKPPVMFSVRLPPELARRARLYAASQGKPVQAVIGAILEAHVPRVRVQVQQLRRAANG